MKRIVLLLGLGLISLKGFAASSDDESGAPDTVWEMQNSNPDHREETLLFQHFNDKKNWRERRNAVQSWRSVAQLDPQQTVSYLHSILSDRSQKVRESAVTALKEMAEDASYFHFRAKIVKALAEPVPRETESLFLRKIKTVRGIFKYTRLYTILQQADESITVLEKLDSSGMDQVLIALHKMAEKGLSNKKNTEVRWFAIQLLNTMLDTLIYHIRGPYAPSVQPEVVSQVSDYIFKGLQIAEEGFADTKPEIRLLTKTLFIKTFQSQKFSDSQVSQIIPTVAKENLSHPSYEVRKNTIDLLLEIAELYPSFKSEIAALVKERLKKENSHHMKIAIRKALKKLTGRKENQALLEQNSECPESFSK